MNYLYDLDDIEKNHEAYAQHQTLMALERGVAPRSRSRAGSPLGSRIESGGVDLGQAVPRPYEVTIIRKRARRLRG